MLLKADGATVSDAQLASLLHFFLLSLFGALFTTALKATTDVGEVFPIFPAPYTRFVQKEANPKPTPSALPFS